MATEYARGAGDAVAALRIVGQLGRYAYLRGHYHEVARVDGPGGGRGPGRAARVPGQGAVRQRPARAPAVRLRARRAAASTRPCCFYRELGDAAGIAACLQALGSVAREQGRYARSAQLHAESLDARRAPPATRGRRPARTATSASSPGCSGDLDRAVTECTRRARRVPRARRRGGHRVVADQPGRGGPLPRRPRRRRRRCWPSRSSCRESIGFREGIAWCEEQLGLVALERGDRPRRAARLRLQLRHAPRAARPLADGERPRGPRRRRHLAGRTERRDRPPSRRRACLASAEATREAIGTARAVRAPQHERSRGRRAISARPPSSGPERGAGSDPTSSTRPSAAAAARHGAAAPPRPACRPTALLGPPPAQRPRPGTQLVADRREQPDRTVPPDGQMSDR